MTAATAPQSSAKLFTPRTYEGYAVMRTPTGVQSMFYSDGDIDRRRDALKLQVRMKLESLGYPKKILYAQDLGLLTSLHGRVEVDEYSKKTAERANFVRKSVADVINEMKIEVVLLQQTPNLLVSRCDDGCGWTSVVGDPDRLIKVKCGYSDFTPPDSTGLTHRFLAKETISRAGEYLVSETKRRDMKNLYEIMYDLPLQDRLGVAADAMTACAYLHSEGLVHCDVKSGNVGVVNNCGIKRGVLFDLESMTREGQSSPISTIHTNVDAYYPNSKGVDSDWATYSDDTFSFGVILMEIFRDSQEERQTLYAELAVARDYRVLRMQQFLRSRINCEEFDTSDLIKIAQRMVSKDTSKRPKLSAVIAKIRKHIGNI